MYLLCIFLSILLIYIPLCTGKKKKDSALLKNKKEKKRSKSPNGGKDKTKNAEKSKPKNDEIEKDNNSSQVKHEKSKKDNDNLKLQFSLSSTQGPNDNMKETTDIKKDDTIKKANNKGGVSNSIKLMTNNSTKKGKNKEVYLTDTSNKNAKKCTNYNNKSIEIDKTQAIDTLEENEDSQKVFDDRVKLVVNDLEKEVNKQDPLKINSNQFFIEDNIEVWACNSLSNRQNELKF
uniref:Uncharacterized protein n=1 Tax=Strongyloides venezuelensis TaxID=75913 RepID=A0A0K0F6D3_STRVS